MGSDFLRAQELKPTLFNSGKNWNKMPNAVTHFVFVLDEDENPRVRMFSWHFNRYNEYSLMIKRSSIKYCIMTVVIVVEAALFFIF